MLTDGYFPKNSRSDPERDPDRDPDPERVPFGQTHFWVRLIRNLGQTDTKSESKISFWLGFRVSLTWFFWSGLTQKWVWHQGTLSGSNLTLEFLECTLLIISKTNCGDTVWNLNWVVISSKKNWGTTGGRTNYYSIEIPHGITAISLTYRPHHAKLQVWPITDNVTANCWWRDVPGYSPTQAIAII